MRISPMAIRAMSFATALSLCAAPTPEEEKTDEQRKPTPPPEPVAQQNLPGETNRQLAARLRAEAAQLASPIPGYEGEAGVKPND